MQQMPTIGAGYEPRDWYEQHATEEDRLRMVSACIQRAQAERAVLENDTPAARMPTAHGRSEAKSAREANAGPHESAHVKAALAQADREDDLYSKCAQAYDAWHDAGCRVAAKCLQWINSLQVGDSGE